MPLQQTVGRGPGWGVSRIGLKLIGVIGVILLATLAIALAAWLAFVEISERIDTISERQVPLFTTSARLAEVGGQITSTAPRLRSARSPWEQEEVWSQLDEQLLALQALFEQDQIANQMPAALRRPVELLLPRIKANLEALNDNVSEGFDLKARNRRLSASLRWSHATFLDEIEPILEDSRFNTRIALDHLVDRSLNGPMQSLNEIQLEMKTRETLMGLNADSNLAVGLILRAASQQSKDEIEETLLFLGEVEDRLRQRLEALETISSTVSLRQAVVDILSFALPGRNLPGLREQELALLNRNQQLLEENKALLQRLKALISDQVTRAESATLEAAAKAHQSVRQGRALLVMMVVFGIIVALGVGWFYVGRSLLGRLNSLRNSMAAIAAGNLETPIDTKGSDEITQMAEALVVFRNTAVEVEEANAEAIIDNALVGLISADAEGRIEFINPNACSLLHSEETALISGHVRQILAPAIRNAFDPVRLAESEAAATVETIGCRQDGSLFPMDLSARCYYQRSKRKYLFTLVDATERQQAQQLLEQRIADRTRDLMAEVRERKRTEAELRAAHQELIQTNKLATLGELSAGIAHELNQPLSAIRYSAHNAAQLVTRERIGDAQACLGKIETLANRMAGTINHLKVFSRRAPDALEAVALAEVVDNALSLFAQRLKRMECEVRWRGREAIPPVLGDPIRLEQVVVNLVGNALDAMENSDSPSLSVEAAPAEETVSLVIADCGTGMPAEVVEKMFDPFFTTKEIGQGLGLGLSISAKIVRDLGGELRVESEPGLGTRIYLNLKRVTENDDTGL
ncbi:ATP-binding protein [Motiliproteus sp. SC1-56]|uniref:ATP-binding protein n=1 Tax=Motiliproteus sp. SC1-56 TaxID=2799565 RepID=UPI001A8D1D20|nr:ATP-binding protein [Motiliproteus sp. SC1-56]